jgi:hypothetical protein
MTLPERYTGPSDKSRTIALILSAVLGVFGAHRFYAGKTGTALLMLITLGGLGIWWLVDLILIAAGGFRDSDGRLIADWDPSTAHLYERNDLESAFDEIERLRIEVGELAERLDFAERLLARPEERRGPTP